LRIERRNKVAKFAYDFTKEDIKALESVSTNNPIDELDCWCSVVIGGEEDVDWGFEYEIFDSIEIWFKTCDDFCIFEEWVESGFNKDWEK
jgi:hypothetical protein